MFSRHSPCSDALEKLDLNYWIFPSFLDGKDENDKVKLL